MSFKLLAIRPLKDCNDKFLKNLEENQIYQFYNDYEFKDGKGNGIIDYQPIIDVKVVEDRRKSLPESFYGENINVCAIVGKNGSGKSALIELLIATIIKVSLIVNENFIVPEELYSQGNEIFDKIKFDENIDRYKKSLQNDLKDLKVEIYYQHDSEFAVSNKSNKVVTYNKGRGIKIRCIQLENEIITIKDQIGGKVEYFLLNDLDHANPHSQNIAQELYYFLGDLFYSMVINYSHYGFNTNEIGEWIKGVFHKNDGYQLPVVINPYRDKGNININSEKDLAKSRFLVNILQEENLREIQKNKKITHISIMLDSTKFKWEKDSFRDSRIANTDEEKKNILRIIFDTFNGEYDLYDDDYIYLNEENHFFNFALDYLLVKLYKITNYPIYRNYRDCFEQVVIDTSEKKLTKFRILVNELFLDYLDSLFVNFSHITDKFRQALFFLQYTYFDLSDIEEDSKAKILEIGTLSNWIKNSYLRSLKVRIEKFYSEDEKFIRESLKREYEIGKFKLFHSLPSFFKVEYYFEDKISNNDFSSFSSGEKQKIFSIHSVIYHLRNLVSIRENNPVGEKNSLKKLIAYKNINIIFDEIELYAHPDFQRAFVRDLLNSFNAMDIKDYSLNIIFITHSPFILSDIPRQNVLFLDNGKITNSFVRSNTFGANITDLFTDNFFLGNYEDNKFLMGNFAKDTIDKIIKWLNDEKRDLSKKNDFKKIIEIVDETLIRSKLLEMYYNIFPDEFDKIKAIEELRRMANDLGIELKE
ncbi:hypothetical protein [Flavobacterium ginsenosidimutans]|uniref:ATPase AAA-type core domain-containing protein n=1 Tax=Flavobacterium ginsenosidimutans TaxID=687844 RepID=A0ABZ2Q5H2_9FLAO